MKKRALLLMSVLLLFGAAPSTFAEVTAEYGLGLYSAYVWRGIVLTDGPSAQPAATISHSSGFAVGFDVLLTPVLVVYYDFDEVEDFYASLGVSYGGNLGQRWSWTLAVSAGSNWAEAVGGTDSGFFEGNASLSIDYGTERWSLGVLGAYTDTLDEKVLPTQPTRWWGGAQASVSF